MPFGLKNAGATYQRAMTAIFHDMIHCELEDYVDDVVVKTETREGYFKTLRRVFERCRQYKLHMNPLKCAFGVAVGKFLGFLVHQQGIDVDLMKAKVIATMKPPTIVKELKSFLGMLSNFISLFITHLCDSETLTPFYGSFRAPNDEVTSYKDTSSTTRPFRKTSTMALATFGVQDCSYHPKRYQESSYSRSFGPIS